MWPCSRRTGCDSSGTAGREKAVEPGDWIRSWGTRRRWHQVSPQMHRDLAVAFRQLGF